VQRLPGLDPGDLVTSRSGGRIVRDAPATGIERAQVRLRGLGYAPHRHDTYAIGVTTSGVQVFNYRGRRQVCLPGEVHVLHPDEVHDGGPGTPEGFSYRILYLAPELVGAVRGDGRLPFVSRAVQPVSPAVLPLLAFLTPGDPLDQLACDALVVAAADLLLALGEGPAPGSPRAVDRPAMERVRAYLAEHARGQVSSRDLESVADADRYSIARQFRAAFGTSPDRYRMQRRLQGVRTAIERGEPLARAAAEAGFADQSHLTRQFKRTYGLTPARWARLTGGAG
jgi:AraC-like DNA-binding protein